LDQDAEAIAGTEIRLAAPQFLRFELAPLQPVVLSKSPGETFLLERLAIAISIEQAGATDQIGPSDLLRQQGMALRTIAQDRCEHARRMLDLLTGPTGCKEAQQPRRQRR